MEFLAIYGDFMEMGFLWIGIAIVALIIKSFTKEYITLCIAAAALITAFMAFNKFDGKIVHQVVTFFASTIVLALFIQPYAMRKNEERRRLEAKEHNVPHKNEKAIVIVKIDNMNATGRISINGEEFEARTANGLPVAEGNTVTVVDHDGRMMLVL
ncbi:MAG: hypothetical protein IJ607_04485 [Bacteroidaceae bacterium]|jgi:membrane protein implicated in regulation of membrane protease activity|nr:hypothetical protein [Bacteroidaceae bacterium]